MKATKRIAVKTNIRGGVLTSNHNEATKRIAVKTGIRAGALTQNHNEQVR